MFVCLFVCFGRLTLKILTSPHPVPKVRAVWRPSAVLSQQRGTTSFPPVARTWPAGRMGEPCRRRHRGRDKSTQAQAWSGAAPGQSFHVCSGGCPRRDPNRSFPSLSCTAGHRVRGRRGPREPVQSGGRRRRTDARKQRSRLDPHTVEWWCGPKTRFEDHVLCMSGRRKETSPSASFSSSGGRHSFRKRNCRTNHLIH